MEKIEKKDNQKDKTSIVETILKAQINNLIDLSKYNNSWSKDEKEIFMKGYLMGKSDAYTLCANWLNEIITNI